MSAAPGPFSYTGFAQRIRFGEGSLAHLDEEVRLLGFSRVAILTGAFHSPLGATVLAQLGPLGAAHLDTAIEHTPLEVTEAAMARLTGERIDGLVAIGGGAAVGLAKAIAARTGLGLLAVPSTFAGSEMTAVLGESDKGVKSTRKDPRVVPRTVLYDSELAAQMPPGLAATSGMNALAHAFEALWAPDANPLTDLLATESIRLLASALPAILAGDDAAGEALLGACFAGNCLATTTMGLHHRLCHLLGGSCALPHAATHAVLLPHVLALNAEAVPTAMGRVASALGLGGAGEVPGALSRLAAGLGVPTSLRALGMDQGAIPQVLETVLASGGANPVPLTKAVLGDLLLGAWAGR